MPGFDGTGPNGMGPMTGRGMGSCNPSNGNYFGRGQGYGRGQGRGIRRGYGIGQSDFIQNDKDILLAQKAELENSLNLINKQLLEFDK